MTKISEAELARICKGIYDERNEIYKHNPIGTLEETLFWMLLSILISYLSVSDIESPCFTGVPTAETYREAINFILRDRKSDEFDVEKYLNQLAKKD